MTGIPMRRVYSEWSDLIGIPVLMATLISLCWLASLARHAIGL